MRAINLRPSGSLRLVLALLPFLALLLAYIIGSYIRLADNPNDKLLPSFAKRLKASLSVITNWCTLYYPLSLEGCNELLHAPYFKPHKVPMHFGIIYKMNKNTTALITVESEPAADMKRLHEEGAVGEVVDNAQYC